MNIFFTVTLKSNLKILKISIPILDNYYKFSQFIIICPYQDYEMFSTTFKKYEKVLILHEDNLLTKKYFKQSALNLFSQLPINENRIGWYYQQALKLIFALKQNQRGTNVVMWDADTIPLRKINFFNGNRSFLYGSLLEYHTPYFKTAREIFLFSMPKLAYTVQFFSLTSLENEFLLKRLQNYCNKVIGSSFSDTSELVSKTILHSIKNAHQRLEESLISEQELVGLSNQMIDPHISPNSIVHFRPNFTWALSKRRLKLLKILGYSHATCEDREQATHTKSNLYFYLFLFKDLVSQRYRLLITYSQTKSAA